jgi:serralysin
MPTQLWRTTHTNKDDFLIGGAGATTLKGDLGDDLILGDSITPFTYGTTHSAAGPANIDSPLHWTTEEDPLLPNTGIPHTSLYVQAEADGMQYSSVTVGDGESITIDTDFGTFTPIAGVSSVNTLVVLELLDSTDTVVATGVYASSPGSQDPGTAVWDSNLAYTNTTGSAQTYTIRFSEDPTIDGTNDTGVFEGGETFVANISVTGHDASPPTTAGNDSLFGGGGNDWLAGQAGNDTLHGDDGDDNLFGGSGNDVLDGGAGFDTAWYNDASSAVVVSLDQAGPQNTGGGGIDTLVSIEFLTGSRFNDTLTGDDGYNTIWGGAGNDTIAGNGGTNFLYGEDGADTLLGGDGSDFLTADRGDQTVWWNNTLRAYGGDDYLYGWYGNDRLYGGAGDDRIEEVAGNDLVDGGAGNDTLIYWNIGAALTINLGIVGSQSIGVGNVTITGIENIIGSQGGDTLTGDDGANRIDGYYGADTIYGKAGDDVLLGGYGDDTIVGGAGNDTVSYDNISGDLTVDLAIATAQNTVAAGMDTITGFENLTGGPNNDHLYGNGSANTIDGYYGNDIIQGRGGDDILLGGVGDDRLDGGSGNDTMSGGTGNDVFIVGSSGDLVSEASGEGTDTVVSSVNYALGNNVEKLRLTGTAHNAHGNSLDNVIIGNGVANTISGDLGNDTLTGDAGADAFRFNTALNASTNVDTITDFAVGTDHIELDDDVFTHAGVVGTLAAGAFYVGSAAHDASDRIIYDPVTGNLYYDADGTGAGAAVLFAHLQTGLAPTNADFQIIG